jgi:hypothetical protein
MIKFIKKFFLKLLIPVIFLLFLSIGLLRWRNNIINNYHIALKNIPLIERNKPLIESTAKVNLVKIGNATISI